MVNKPYYWRARKAWYLRVETESGNWSQRKVGENEDEAYETWRKMLAEAEEAKRRKLNPDPPLLDVIDQWIGWMQCQVSDGKRSQNYFSRVCQTTEDLLVHFYEQNVTAVNSKSVQQWIDSKSWSAKTQSTAVGHLRAILNWAQNKDIITKAPAISVEFTGRQTKREQIVDPEIHQKLMLECLKAPYRLDRRFTLFLAVLFHTGCRPGELANLQISDWKGDYWIQDGKTTRKTGRKRVVYTVGCAATALRILVNNRESGPVFSARNGTLTRNAIRIRMKRLRIATGLPSEVVAYCYRHGFTHRSLVNGVSSQLTAELLGHASTRMIEQVYGHLDKARDVLKEAASMVAKKAKGEDRN